MLKIEADTGVTPRALLEKPMLTGRTVLFWSAYQDLHNCRTYGMESANPIQVSEIKAYLDIIQVLGVDDRMEYFRHIKTMDTMFFEHVNAKRSKAAPPKK